MSKELESGAVDAAKFAQISIPERRELIENWIFSERDRYILTRRLIDGITVAQIAEELENDPRFGYMSTRGIDYALQRGKQILLSHIKIS